MNKDTLWIFRTFGFKAGVRFLWDSIKLFFKRTVKREKPMKFSELTDAEAEQVAYAFGIHKWEDRDHLNRIWHNFEKTLN
jgi:hypothetical protein